jgi:hypothetical protein
MPAPYGRSRYNVLGAVNAIGNDIITVCNTNYINADSVREPLRKIRAGFANETIPITLILDNAKYQHCKIVKDLADELKIERIIVFAFIRS